MLAALLLAVYAFLVMTTMTHTHIHHAECTEWAAAAISDASADYCPICQACSHPYTLPVLPMVAAAVCVCVRVAVRQVSFTGRQSHFIPLLRAPPAV